MTAVNGAQMFGGEMELDLLALSGTADVSTRVMPNAVRLTAGRTALGLIARAAASTGRQQVILPAYLCDSMLAPFERAGLAVAFYPLTFNLGPDIEFLTAMLARDPRATVLVAHYFGFPTGVDAVRAIRTASPETWLVEDCSHGSLIEPLVPSIGRVGDFVFTSCRKYLPLPDGALLVNRTTTQLCAVRDDPGRFVRYRLAAKVLRSERLRQAVPEPGLEEMYLRLFAAAETELDRTQPVAAMSALSSRLLDATDLGDVMRRRRANFEVLAAAFSDRTFADVATPLFTRLTPETSPLVFPIRVHDGGRDWLRQALAERFVYAPVHWPLPEAVPAGRFTGAEMLAEEMLGLPIDQRYNPEEMGRLIDVVIDAVRAGRR